ncbi:histidine ammonia-lyase [Salinigranum marinum]|uniref:histidine ammonia-lyase n=1 Tax=Salinigranum marinum TaxID=1515595 RepID=UPI002989DBCF|nr:histidine ammonia-lyase [Salinigranum marinum]
MPEVVEIDGETLTPEQIEAVARDGAAVTVPESVRRSVRESRDRIETILETDEPVYGVNTGFGELVQERIPEARIGAVQRNLVRSHAAGAGEELPKSVVRAMMTARVNTLVKGYSGVRECVVDLLVQLLNQGVHPVVRSKGSLGASGDLAPLAHMTLVLIGEGEATVDGDRMDGAAALERVDLDPLVLGAKEGLALINGTQLTTCLGALVVLDAERAVRAADVAGAMTTEVTMSTTASSHPRINDVRPHQGHREAADNVRALTADSEIVQSHRNCDRVQDAYSIRCLPQVHGAVRDAVRHLRNVVTVELNSATDNPLIFDADRVDPRASGTDDAAVLSGGNFHGEPLALPLDYVTSAIAELASISERRLDRLLNPNVQAEHLPPFLTADAGVQSGYMITQYVAADLVSTNRAEGRPSMDNVPVSGNQEDHVSMSAQSALRAADAVERTLRVVASELVCATQAIDFVDPAYTPGSGTKAAYDCVRDSVPYLDDDRPVHADVDAATDLIVSDLLFERVEAATDEPLQ